MTYRSLSLHNPDFNPNNEPKIEPATPPPIRFRHIALLLLGGIVVGGFSGALTGLIAYRFTHSNFVTASAFGISVYATLAVGYHWTSQEQGWAGLRVRFLPVGRKPQILSALGAVALIAFMSMMTWILRWSGVKIADVPSPIELDSWTQLPLALVFIAVFAPFTEELLFRGLLLDWLKEKMNVWLAAVILSVIFSLLHANPFSLGAVGWLAFTGRFLLGMGASALTIKYHSLRPAFAMHATWNAIAGFASVLSSG